MTGSPFVSAQGPPYSIHSERVVVSALVADPKLIPDIVEIMPDASAFYGTTNERLYLAILQVHRATSPQDTDALILAMEELELLEPVGGSAALRAHAEESQGGDAARQHALNLVEKARMRLLIEALADLLNGAYRTTEGAEAMLQHARQRLDELARDKPKSE